MRIAWTSESAGVTRIARPRQARLNRSVSLSNSSTISRVRVGLALRIEARKSSVVARCADAAEVLALERPLRRRARRPLDVGRGEEVAGRDDRLDVDRLVGDLADVALPDHPPRLGVGRADGQHVVEAAGAEEGGVEPRDPVRRAREQVVGRLAHARDLLQELVRDARADASLVAAHRREILDLVDEDDGRGHARAARRTSRRAASPAAPGPRRRSRTARPRRTASRAARRFPSRTSSCRCPGGPKRMIAFGCTTPWRRASSGSASGRITRRSMISFGSSMPRSSSQRPGSIIRPPSCAIESCEPTPASARS